MKKVLNLLSCAMFVFSFASAKPIKGTLKDYGDYATCKGRKGMCGFTGFQIMAQSHIDIEASKVFFFPEDYLGTMPSNAYFDNEYKMFRVDNVRIEEYLRCVSTELGGEMDDIVKCYNSLDTSKIAFISVALDEDKNKWKTAKTTNKINWTSMWQEDGVYGDLCLHYNLYSMPFFILFTQDKKIYFIKDGASEFENIKQEFKAQKLIKL